MASTLPLVTGPIPDSIALSTYPAPAATSTLPTTRDLWWEWVCEAFSRHEVVAHKEAARGWSPAIFHEGTTRADANVEAISCAVLDFDHVDPEDRAELERQLRRLGLAHVLYSTFQSTETAPRFRLVMPFVVPFPVGDDPVRGKQRWETEIYAALRDLFPGSDRTTHEPSRFYYWPSVSSDGAPFVTLGEGQALDWRAWVEDGELPTLPARNGTAHIAPASALISPDEIHPLGRQALEFLSFGCETDQRWRALAAARDLWRNGQPLEVAIEKIWQGLQACPQTKPDDPWTYAQAVQLTTSIYKSPAQPLPPLPETPTVYLGGALAVPSPTSMANTEVAPKSLDELLTIFHHWLSLPDPAPIELLLGTIACNLMDGDPVWLMFIGGPGWGKTEILNSAARLPHVHLAATLTEAALLSGTPKRDTAKGASGGLLRVIGDFGILICKDFTSILSMHGETRAGVLAALREVYDGSWTRHVGVDGGRTLDWRGKVAVIAACTAAIDTHHAVIGSMGERFVFYRIPAEHEQEQAAYAMRHAGHEAEMRQELVDGVAGFFASLVIPDTLPDISTEEEQRIIELATLAARCRSAVERDRNSEIELIPPPEAPGRLALVFRRLFAGLQIVGISALEAWRVLLKVGLDCMPSPRRAAFLALLERDDGAALNTSNIATLIDYPTTTTRRTLEDLAAHGVVRREARGSGKADYWYLSDWARARWNAAQNQPTVSEISGDI